MRVTLDFGESKADKKLLVNNLKVTEMDIALNSRLKVLRFASDGASNTSDPYHRARAYRANLSADRRGHLDRLRAHLGSDDVATTQALALAADPTTWPGR